MPFEQPRIRSTTTSKCIAPSGASGPRRLLRESTTGASHSDAHDTSNDHPRARPAAVLRHPRSGLGLHRHRERPVHGGVLARPRLHLGLQAADEADAHCGSCEIGSTSAGRSASRSSPTTTSSSVRATPPTSGVHSTACEPRTGASWGTAATTPSVTRTTGPGGTPATARVARVRT